MELLDVTGRMIQRKYFAGNSYQVDLKELSKGIYYLKITSGNSTEIKKVIKN